MVKSFRGGGNCIRRYSRCLIVSFCSFIRLFRYFVVLDRIGEVFEVRNHYCGVGRLCIEFGGCLGYKSHKIYVTYRLGQIGDQLG